MNRSHIYHWFILKECLAQIIDIHYPIEIIMLIIMKNYEQIKVSCGSFHTFLIKEDKIYGWGSNELGQLGLRDGDDRKLPTKFILETESPIKSISCGLNYTITLTEKNDCYGWGFNKYNQLGLKDNILHWTWNSPQKLNLLNIRSVSCGGYHTIALTLGEGTGSSSHTVARSSPMTKSNKCYVWGDNDHGQLGLGNTNKYDMPMELFLENILSVGCGRFHSVALIYLEEIYPFGDESGFVSSSENQIYVWGSNQCGQLGLGDDFNRNKPQKLILCSSGSSNIISVSCGEYFTMALTRNGTLYSWGYNESGQLGLGNYHNQNSPHQISLQESIVKISCGLRHTAVLTKCGKLYTWGFTDYEQLGYIINNIPQKIILDESIISICCGRDNTFAITNLDKIYVWGYNDGQLGLGDSTHRTSPQELKLS